MHSQAPKKVKDEETEEDAAFKAQKKAEAEALKAAKAKGMESDALLRPFH